MIARRVLFVVMVDRAGDRRDLRHLMRQRRASLSADQQETSAMAVAKLLTGMAVLDCAVLVAGYRAVRGELNIDGFLSELVDRGVTVTIPRVVGDDLQFLGWTPDTLTAPGAFGIPEPVAGEPITLDRHDVVLAPLVAFDPAGNRLGQGGGYYDRALVFNDDRRPVIIGIAHRFAQVAGLATEPWDQPVDVVVTDHEVIEFRPEALKPRVVSVRD